eukprot:3007580-Pleurochrysis_carterae.AAC.1
MAALAVAFVILALRLGAFGVAFGVGANSFLRLADRLGLARSVARKERTAIRSAQLEVALDFAGLSSTQH